VGTWGWGRGGGHVNQDIDKRKRKPKFNFKVPSTRLDKNCTLDVRRLPPVPCCRLRAAARGPSV